MYYIYKLLYQLKQLLHIRSSDGGMQGELGMEGRLTTKLIKGPNHAK